MFVRNRHLANCAIPAAVPDGTPGGPGAHSTIQTVDNPDSCIRISTPSMDNPYFEGRLAIKCSRELGSIIGTRWSLYSEIVAPPRNRVAPSIAAYSFLASQSALEERLTPFLLISGYQESKKGCHIFTNVSDYEGEPIKKLQLSLV